MTSAVWKKLNLKDERHIAVLNAPESFEADINALSRVQVVRDLSSISGLTFMIAFVTQRDEINLGFTHVSDVRFAINEVKIIGKKVVVTHTKANGERVEETFSSRFLQ